MSLFDSASLVVTPNGVKEGKLYSIKPTDGSGDLVVTRATTATRVNSAGLVEVVPRNLLTYSNTFTNAIWAKANATITTSQIGYDGTNNASLLVEDSSNSSHYIRQTPSLSGQITISVYAKANTRNWLYLRGVQAGVPVFGWFNLSNGTLGTIQTNGTGSITSVGNGWYRCSLTIANFNTGFETYIGVSSSDNNLSYLGNGSSIFIQNAQVENFATATDYYPTTTRLNIPRLDYINGTCPSILVDPQRTNTLLQSENLATSWTSFRSVVTTNVTTAPSGISTADKIAQQSGTTDAGGVYQTISLTSGSTYTYSYYAKAGGYNWTFARVIDGVSNYYVWFNLSTGVVGTISGSATAKIQSVGNGWYRCSVTFTSAGTGNQVVSYVGNSDNSDQVPSSDGVKGIYVWGQQLEAGSYATSYIPTTSASVTRNADVISKTGISSLIGQTEGTLFADLKFTNVGTEKYILNLKDIAGSNVISFRRLTSGEIRFVLTATTSSGTTNQSTAVLPNGNYKIAYKYVSGSLKIFINGALLFTLTPTFTFGTALSIIEIGNQNSGSQLNDSINLLSIFKTALTDEQCINLTTL